MLSCDCGVRFLWVHELHVNLFFFRDRGIADYIWQWPLILSKLVDSLDRLGAQDFNLTRVRKLLLLLRAPWRVQTRLLSLGSLLHSDLVDEVHFVF